VGGRLPSFSFFGESRARQFTNLKRGNRYNDYYSGGLEAADVSLDLSWRTTVSNATQETTFLAAHTFFKGELHLAGPATIAGRVEGTIVSQDQLQIAAEGILQGDIEGVLVDIQGTVTGNILATRACRLGATARVNGELRAANLAIAEGACFVGQVQVGLEAVEELAAPANEVEIEQPRAAAPTNRLQTMTEEINEVAAEAVAAMSAPMNSGPTVTVMPQNIQQTLNRVPRIIRARV
jgi:cytoskeletal protein CcmA (bactofilin family)